MDLFDYMRSNTMEKEAPLASRLRPATLDEVVGQKHIIGKDKLLYRAIKADKRALLYFTAHRGQVKDDAGQSNSRYDKRQIQAAECNGCGKKDMEEVVQEAKRCPGMYGQRLSFVDEIHRFNKSQQDHLLPL